MFRIASIIEVFLLVFVTYHATADDCIEPFRQFNDMCYYRLPLRMNFLSALKTCKRLNSTVVNIHSEAENAHVLSLTDGAPTWIGLKRIEPFWIWSDNTKPTYLNWHRFQPDHCCGVSVFCSQMNVRWNNQHSLCSDGKWYDTSCFAYNQVVCSYKVAARQKEVVTTTPAPCHAGYTELGDGCYRVGSAPLPESRARRLRRMTILPPAMTQSEARERCKAEGADLASIFNHDVNTRLGHMVKEYNLGYAWFGLAVDLTSGGDWTRKFSDGTYGCYANWLDSKPDNLNVTNNDCTIMSPEGKWDDFACHDNEHIRLFICKTPHMGENHSRCDGGTH